MTCRHCVRASLKLCPKMLKAFPEILQTTARALLRPEPLVLVNSAGERFKAYFHCKANPCEMTITPEATSFAPRAPPNDDKDRSPPPEAAGRSADTHPDERRRSSEKRSASKRSLPEKRFTRDNQSSRRSGAFAKFDNKHRKSGRTRGR